MTHREDIEELIIRFKKKFPITKVEIEPVEEELTEFKESNKAAETC